MGNQIRKAEFANEHVLKIMECINRKLMYQFRSKKHQEKIEQDILMVVNERENYILTKYNETLTTPFNKKIEDYNGKIVDLENDVNQLISKKTFLQNVRKVNEEKILQLQEEKEKLIPSKSLLSRLKYLFTGKV